MFDKDILNHSISDANQHLFQTMKEALRRIYQSQEKNDDALLESIQKEIISALPEALPSIEQVAETLNIGAHTLQRRLSDKGYNFSKLLDLTRRQLAMNYLQNTTISTSEIAFLLAYSETSAFDRAFKRWTSMKPLEYRQRHNR
ncbi:AraC family transcriptional regulator [Microbulbifer bruguierae]|uniref:AraC family transcriptional regulator n=1 Tax=Microbulbifer bruguierae TaxID=3029061 RepID=A0ABY8ND49_9GAMM|nr:AraC family transcriptional regulator [Microbulbifer bruguierae]WGL16527.1 AraC family transcriptional regulator [Microbulbifer bruguierae]